jgi:Swt1-like HEPN
LFAGGGILLDETLRKLFAAQEAEHRLTDQLEAIRRQTEPLSTALEMIERQSAVSRLTEEMNWRQEILRTTLSPLEEFHRAGVFGSVSLLSEERPLIQQAIADYEARFHLPEMSEATRLITQIQSTGATAFLGSPQEQITVLQHAIEAMKSPWLDAENALHSISAFAELQGIGQALRSLAPFDIRLANALRPELGDWRQTIEWPSRIFTDPIARTEFYIELGLNTALTDFPAPAFNEGLSIAGLRETPATKDNDEQQGFARTNAAHDRLQRFEAQLRRFIDERMTAVFGLDWIKHQVPGDILKAWREKKQKAMDNGEQGWPLIAYADFTDYVPLITRKDNWEKVFKPIFRRVEFVQESFQRLYPIRICTMHARIITQDDELYLHVEIKRILSAIDPS